MKKNGVVSIVRYFLIIVVKQNSVVSVVSEEKQRSQCSEIFHYISTEVEERS